jgi:hypothetical protein
VTVVYVVDPIPSASRSVASKVKVAAAEHVIVTRPVAPMSTLHVSARPAVASASLISVASLRRKSAPDAARFMRYVPLSTFTSTGDVPEANASRTSYPTACSHAKGTAIAMEGGVVKPISARARR